MRIVFAGTPETALPSLRALVDSRHDVAAVLTRPDAAAGRGRHLRPSPVAAFAREQGIEVLTPPTPSDPEFLARLREIEPECCPIVAYGALLRREALDVPTFGWVNLHFSVLPAWRGAAPVQRAIMAGDEVTGATVFSLVEELDAGPVLGTITERIRDDDTAGTLLERLADFGARLLVDVVDHIEDGDIGAVAQSEDAVSYAAKITTADARIRWDLPAFAVDRQIRGCTPTPGHGRLSVDGADRSMSSSARSPRRTTRRSTPGEIAFEKHAVRVGTATTDVLLGAVQPHGKKSMAAADWGRGLRVDRAVVRMTDPARQAAFDALRAVDERDAFVNLLLPPLLRERRLDARAAALATELAHGTLRWRGTYDAIIDHLAPGRTIEPAVRDVLRLGCHQILSMRVPDHAAVSTSVDLVKSAVGHRATGFTNAILRRVAARPLDDWLAELTAGLAADAALSVRTSHPEWIVAALRDALGRDGDLEALLAADNLPPKVTLVARPGLCEPERAPRRARTPVAVRADPRRRRPVRHPGRPRGTGRRPGRRLAAGRPEAGRGRARRPGRTLARPVRRARWQGGPARRVGSTARARRSSPTRSSHIGPSWSPRRSPTCPTSR